MMAGDGEIRQVTGITLAHVADPLSFSWPQFHSLNLVFLLPIPNTPFVQHVEVL